ncbi:MAG: ATP-binding cassette domain-containing protein, partial [Actinobacteria bacterium]|nr:ATP-binding cassette domain-containing protein [Actinomycetota bacterium]
AGNGQSEMVEALWGLRPISHGSIRVTGTEINHTNVATRRSAGMAYIPEDRHRLGTASKASLSSNLLMGFQTHPDISRRGWLDLGAVDAHASELIEQFDIKASSPDMVVGTLSGGNLQRVVVARELAHHSPLLIAEQPTRGLDIGAIAFIRRRLTDFRDAGGAVLMVSAELSEIQTLSTRILVMFEGSIVAELDPEAVTEAEIGLYMTGSHAV